MDELLSAVSFPKGFLWGCCTAAHQVEGGNTNNDWYAWERLTGSIYGAQRSGDACDWWNNAEADLKLAAAMGQTAHRFSVEWSRVEPHEGVWDDAAIERYRTMLRFMRDNGLEPMITLHHFTTPLWKSLRSSRDSNVSPVRWQRRSASTAAFGSR
jgi:beta-glucosidase